MQRSLTVLALLSIALTSTAQFGPQHFAFDSDVHYPYRIWFDDLNGDGHTDAIAWDNNQLLWWANDGNGVFGEKQVIFGQYLTYPQRLASADIDGDGDKDVVGQDGWWANDGAGNFAFASIIDDFFTLAMVGDVDGDGDVDLVGKTGVLNGNVLTMFFGTIINDGNGNFSDGVSLGSNAGTDVNAAQGDLDNDGDMDLVVGGDANLIGYYPNMGLGVYGARQVIPNLAGTPMVQTADVEGDGDMDLFAFGASPGNRWFANDGSAVFTVADTLGGGAPVADVDNDGDIDMIVGTGTTCDAKWYRNDGDGLAWSTLNVELFSGYNLAGTKYAFADINEDGFQDMAICHGLGIIAWYPNNGDGTFALRERIGHELSGGTGLAVADLDGDGDNDIAAAGSYGDWITTYANNGDGTFAQQDVVIEHLDQVSTCRAADLNGDGFPELLTNKTEAAVLWNDGTGHFTPGTLPNNGVAPLGVDLDGDFDLDLVGTGKWYRNEGSGGFTEVVDATMNITGATKVTSGLVNADAFPDLIYFGATVNVLLNDGNGNFTTTSTTPTSQLGLLDVADLDADGDNDLVGMDNGFGDLLYTYFNDGNGGLTEQLLLDGDQGVPRHLIAYDTNDDGNPDVIWARSNGYDHKTYATLNNGDGTMGNIFLVDPSAESTAGLAFADVNGDAVPDLIESRFHSIAWQENHFFDAFRFRGDVFKDYDQNSVRDVTDVPLPFLPMRTEPSAVLNWTNSFGQFDMAVDSGTTYELWPHLPTQFHVTSEPDTVISEANVTEPIVDSLLFGIGPMIPDDFEAMTFTRTLLRCNTAGAFYVDVRNTGATILTNVLVQVELDPDLTLDQPYPAPDSVVANTVYWSIASMDWLAIEHFVVHVIAGPVGSSGMATCSVDFTSTGATAEETIGLTTVTCAYDPNLKEVLPAGTGTHHAVPIDQDWLDFTIHFQNTGTDTAFNVLLVDRLSADLDWQSMEILGASHPLTNIFIQEDGELNFRYDHINLPDSGANMAGSNGYVRFRMRPLANRPNLTEIHNTAEIYFDYNAPVITNTTLTTLVDCDAFTSSVTQLDADLLQASEGLSYQWYQDGIAMPGATSQELVVGVTGFYSVEVTNGYGCVLLSDELQVVIEGVITASMLHMAVVPNPMSDRARLILSEALHADSRIELVDASGRSLRVMFGNGSREVLMDRGHLESGLYVLRVMRDGEHIGSTRIIIH